MRWSVGIQADADRTLSRQEVVELADAAVRTEAISEEEDEDLAG